MRIHISFMAHVFSLTSLRSAYGLASVAAYKAYGDPNMLTLAQAGWEYGMNYTVSTQNAAVGTIVTKNFTLSSSCQGRECPSPVYESLLSISL